MPKAEILHTPSRRKFLGHLAGGAAAAAVTAGVTKVTHAAPAAIADGASHDVELIRLCGELEALSEEHKRLCEDIPEGPTDADADPIYRDMDAVGKRILATQPITREGYAAFARALLVYDPELVSYEGVVMSHTLLAKLLRSLAATSVNGGAA